MKKIDSLTPEQEAKLEVYYNKWLKIGLNATKTTDEMKRKAEECIKKIYTNEKFKIPEIIWVKSPMAGAKKCIELGDDKNNLIYSCGYGSHDASWLGFYDFMLTELRIKECEQLLPIMELAKVSGWWWPYENVCVVSQLPVDCIINKDGNLHNEDSPALKYEDDFCLYMLNGIEVPDWLVLTKKEDLDPKMILEIKNAEVRLQGVKKIGAKRLIEALGANIVDTKTYDAGGKYDLLKVDWTGSERYYLRMVNPSTNEIVIEPVHPDCKTVDQALGFRMSALVGDDWKNKSFVYKKPVIYT